MNRRSFLKRAGAATLAVVAAPLFIPSERLDFGVPKRRLIVPEPLLTRTLIGPDDEDVQSFVMPRNGHDAEWERGIARFMKNFGAEEYRIDAHGASGKAPLLQTLSEPADEAIWASLKPIIERDMAERFEVSWHDQLGATPVIQRTDIREHMDAWPVRSSGGPLRIVSV